LSLPPALPSSLTFANLCELTLAALPQRCHLIGWSLGGLVATELALRHPHRFYSVTSVASSPYFPATADWPGIDPHVLTTLDRKSTRLNSSHVKISYAVFCLKKT